LAVVRLVVSVARCAIFPPNLAIFEFGWRVADFLAIFEIFRWKVWQIFVQDSDQRLVHKNLKINLILYTAAKFIVSECVRSFVPVPVASVQGKPCVWLKA